ncbi:hypothetical protein BDV37DRAFT_293190 [Aspergillus pseudonomiae]|uniref:Ribosome maturation protein SDO1/SBDS N-terminal domain-containing protein n=1 Tax=Aspergillus pseudonomiae TaxID=1506151 RepID=A0A5N7CRM5_9EURO|nr:uncharacterized protein BDV37DRAFT_293190 [Aspergillus pseudonomiae]KAE8396851.1 hypothetical protein BDV37DRAFT_293190 [Aspergillus pseudonomiae]
MTRGNTRQSKVFYKGPIEGFAFMVEDVTAMQNWRRDHSIPLAQVLDGWKIFTSRIHNEASRATLELEFGTSNDNDENINIERKGIRNESQGPWEIH